VADLQREKIEATLRINLLHLQRLHSLGVSRLTTANLGCRDQAGWGVVRAKPGADGLFLTGEGAPHMLLPVTMDGDLIDLVAFQPSAPSHWMLRTGLGWALGMDRGLEPYTWGDVPTVHETPLDWLRADCTGICVLDWSAPELHSLRGIAKIACATDQLAQTLARQLARDPNLPEIITVPNGTERQAA
jgi:hypothetical protein